MASMPERQFPDLRDDQMIAIGIYGESIAAYRYTVLSERVPGPGDKKTFSDIAQEELQHKERLQRLFQQHYPGTAFYLSDEDKALVLTGPRLIDVRDLEDYREVMQIALNTELRTAQYYQVMSRRAKNPEIQAVFKELAVEGFEHHRQLEALARERGFLPPPVDP